jgi:hypothetical protein
MPTNAVAVVVAVDADEPEALARVSVVVPPTVPLTTALKGRDTIQPKAQRVASLSFRDPRRPGSKATHSPVVVSAVVPAL